MSRPSLPDLRRWATDLLDQQLWCWGQDIIRAEGNLLLEYGLIRFRPSGGQSKTGCTQYKAFLSDGEEIWLWGFGLLHHQPGNGSVFLRRYGFDPMLVEHLPPHPIHEPEDLGRLTRPEGVIQSAQTWVQVRRLAQWVAGYERWVAERVGLAYRTAVLEVRGKKASFAAAEMASTWEWLAENVTRKADPQGGINPWCMWLASYRIRWGLSVDSSLRTEQRQLLHVPGSHLKSRVS